MHKFLNLLLAQRIAIGETTKELWAHVLIRCCCSVLVSFRTGWVVTVGERSRLSFFSPRPLFGVTYYTRTTSTSSRSHTLGNELPCTSSSATKMVRFYSVPGRGILSQTKHMTIHPLVAFIELLLLLSKSTGA